MDSPTAIRPMPLTTEHRLETENLRLTTVQLVDVEEYVGLLTDPEVMKFIGVEEGKLPKREEVVEIVTGGVAAWRKRGYGRWSIFERSQNEFVGFTGFRSEDGVPELISVVHERFWGNGYAFEAGRAAVDYAFESLGFEKVMAVSRPANLRARALIERLGFEFKGIIDFHGVEGASYLLTRE